MRLPPLEKVQRELNKAGEAHYAGFVIRRIDIGLDVVREYRLGIFQQLEVALLAIQAAIEDEKRLPIPARAGRATGRTPMPPLPWF